MFEDIESIDSLAIKEKRKHKIFDSKFGLTIGVYGQPSYAWNYIAWEAFKKTREILYESEDDNANELYNRAEIWRKP